MTQEVREQTLLALDIPDNIFVDAIAVAIITPGPVVNNGRVHWVSCCRSPRGIGRGMGRVCASLLHCALRCAVLLSLCTKSAG
jgi:hypothetical protein